jgi:hypothetical protein
MRTPVQFENHNAVPLRGAAWSVFGQGNVLRALAATTVVVALLALLLPGTASHHGLPPLWFVVVPVFFFGTVDLQRSLWPIPETSRRLPPQTIVLPSLFQRPPPTKA